MLKYLTLLALVFALLALSTCTKGSSQELTDNIWLLTELVGKSPLPDTNITAALDEDGNVNGSAGCNTYGTSYDIDGDKLIFGENIRTTLMMCPEPVMEQERAFFGVLVNISTFEIADDELILYDAAGNALAKFEAVSQSLEGSSWDVLSYNNGKEAVVSVIIDTEITAIFDEDGQLTGSAGCNNYFASYETDGDKISIGPAGVTQMFCNEPEGIMEQEQQYLAALENADTYKISGMTMEMRTSDGAMVANFRRAAMP